MTEYAVLLSDETRLFEAPSDQEAVQRVTAWSGVAALQIRETATSRLVWAAQGHLVRFRAYWPGANGSILAVSDRDAISGVKNWPNPLPDRIEEVDSGRTIWVNMGQTPDLWKVVICLPSLNTDHYILWVGEPPMEEIQRVWELGGSRTQVRPRGWRGPLAEAYPGLASIEKLKVHGKGRLSQ